MVITITMDNYEVLPIADILTLEDEGTTFH